MPGLYRRSDRCWAIGMIPASHRRVRESSSHLHASYGSGIDGSVEVLVSPNGLIRPSNSDAWMDAQQCMTTIRTDSTTGR